MTEHNIPTYILDLCELHSLLTELADAGCETEVDNMIVNGDMDLTQDAVTLCIADANDRLDRERLSQMTQ